MKQLFESSHVYTHSELEAAARTGKHLDRIGYGYQVIGEPKTVSPDFDARWINTQGMGNHGTLVVTGISPRGRRVVREGKAARLAATCNIPLALARIAARQKYGMEPDVATLASELSELPTAALIRAKRAGSHREAQYHLRRGYPVSFPRLGAALDIALSYQFSA